MVLAYNTVNEEIGIGYYDASLSAAEELLGKEYTCYRVDGEVWTELLQILIEGLLEE